MRMGTKYVASMCDIYYHWKTEASFVLCFWAENTMYVQNPAYSSTHIIINGMEEHEILQPVAL